MIAHQTIPDNFPITNESLSDLIGKAFWWGENEGPVILFCGPLLAQALLDFGLDEFWVEILPYPDEPLNPEIVEIGANTAPIPSEFLERVSACCERQETLDKLLKN